MGLLLFVFSLIPLLIVSWAIWKLVPLLLGAPYVPSEEDAVEAMVRLAHVKPGERMVDLGSGDGRVVAAFARAGAEAHGYEINPFLVRRARRAIKRAGLADKAFVHWGSFWSKSFKNFQIVTVYGVSPMMSKLEKKLRCELPLGARVLAQTFPFPEWNPAKIECKIYLYTQT